MPEFRYLGSPEDLDLSTDAILHRLRPLLPAAEYDLEVFDGSVMVTGESSYARVSHVSTAEIHDEDAATLAVTLGVKSVIEVASGPTHDLDHIYCLSDVAYHAGQAWPGMIDLTDPDDG